MNLGQLFMQASIDSLILENLIQQLIRSHKTDDHS